MLRPIYTAIDDTQALMVLTAFVDSVLGKKYPAAVAACQTRLDAGSSAFLGFGLVTRKVIYTATSIESLNYQLRKITQEPRPIP